MHQILGAVTGDFYGVMRRTSFQEAAEMITPEQKYQQRAELGELLLERIYYKVFLQRELSGSVEKPRKPTNLIAILFQEGKIKTFAECTACNYKWQKKNSKEKPAECPECKSSNVIKLGGCDTCHDCGCSACPVA